MEVVVLEVVALLLAPWATSALNCHTLPLSGDEFRCPLLTLGLKTCGVSVVTGDGDLSVLS